MLCIFAIGLEENGVIDELTQSMKRVKIFPLVLMVPCFFVVLATLFAFFSTTACSLSQSYSIPNLLSYYFHKDEYHYSAVGASGAVTGILYSAILFYPDMGLYLFFIPIAIPAWIFGILYLMYSIYGMKKQLGNIGHDAHFGGAVAGYVLTLAFAPFLFQEQLWIIILLAIPIVILFVMQRSGNLNRGI